MHCLRGICLVGIINGSDFRKGGRRWSRGSYGMQHKSIGFGLSGKTVDVITGYSLASKMRDGVSKSRNDGKRELSKIVIASD